jgi:esterase/lipase superfamily enzyme
MRREHRRWKSPSLGKDMDMLIFGHAGARVLVFPTSMGRFFEWEDRGMIGALSEHLEKGWLQLYCVDSVDDESWYATHRHPADRARRHEAYERYLMHEVLPLSTHLNDNSFLITTGASFGAYHAMSFGLRHPGITGRVLGMSGLYDIKEQTGGYSDDAVYFNNPADFIRNEHDPARLSAIRRMDIVLRSGATIPCTGPTRCSRGPYGGRASRTLFACGMAGRTIGRGGNEWFACTSAEAIDGH